MSLLLTVLLVVLLCIFPALALASASASQPPPAPEDELICHTSDPSECYPRIFRATNEFQTVHEDQDLPKGLHVRMNMTSGKLEAKINVEGEVPPELEGVAVGTDAVTDQSVLVVEPEIPDEPQIPRNAPKYEPVGKIKEPENAAQYFFEALKVVKAGAEKDGARELDQALESLKEISHDIYYGLKITEDKAVLKSLLCLMVDRNTPLTEGVSPRDQQAANILAAALSNNPTALSALSKEWTDLMGSACPGDTVPLSQRFYSSFLPEDTSAAVKDSADKAKAKVSAINGLIKDDAIRAEFLRNGGMSLLLEVLALEDKEWASVQRKAGQLALDNFLDEDMGATLGEWPRVARMSDKQCQAGGSRTDEGCWDFHVERIMKENKKDGEHWSKDLHDRLASLRKSNDGPPEHVEL